MVDQVSAVQTGGFGKAVASTFIPGLGQLMDGRNKEGAGYMGGTLATQIGGAMAIGHAMKRNFAAGEQLDHDVFTAESNLRSAVFEAEMGAKTPTSPLDDTLYQRIIDAKKAAVEASPEVKAAREALENATKSGAENVAKVAKSMKKYTIAGGLLLLAGTVLEICNIVDAYKGGKKS